MVVLPNCEAEIDTKDFRRFEKNKYPAKLTIHGSSPSALLKEIGVGQSLGIVAVDPSGFGRMISPE